MTPDELKDLTRAYQFLHSPSIAMKAANMIGRPLEIALENLPESVRSGITSATQLSLDKAMDAAVFTMDEEGGEASPIWHKIAVAVSGGVGGLFGLPALAIELPLSTVIMLRSIMDIARSEGERVSDREAQLQCLMVFALGGESPDDDGAESGYYACRIALGRAMGEALEYIAKSAVIDKGAPVLVRFIAALAERFGVQVTEKVLAQGIPLIGAAGGALINTLFIDHFQDMARGHFIVRRLERAYGEERVQAEFEAIKNGQPQEES